MTIGIPLGFRLRVRNEADTADLLNVSSIVGQNPYVAAPPDNGDGAQVDPITGQYTRGSYSIDVIDALVGGQPVVAAIEEWNTYGSPNFFLPVGGWAEQYFDNLGVLDPTRTGDWEGFNPVANPSDPGAGYVGTSSLTGNLHTMAYLERTWGGFVPGNTYTLVAAIQDADNGAIGIEMNGVFARWSLPSSAGAAPGTGGTAPAGRNPWGSLQVTAVADGSGNLVVRLGYWLIPPVNAPTGDGNLLVGFWGKLTIFEGTTVAPQRIVTRVLNDANGLPQLLSKKAFIEQTPDGGTTWNLFSNGYVNRIELTNALIFRFTVGDTQQTANSKMMFSRCIDPAGNFDKGSCILGGPVRGGFGPLPDAGQWRFKVIDVDTWGVAVQVVQANAAKDANGPYKPGYSIGTPTLNLLNRVANDFQVATGVTATPTIGGVGYALPATFDIGVRVTPVSTGTLAGVFVPYAIGVPGFTPQQAALLFPADNGAIIMAFRWTGTGTDVNGNAQPAQPSVGDLLDVYAYPLAISQQAPLHWFGTPVDLATQALTYAGYSFDATSATAVKTILGPTLFLMLRITEAMSLADLLSLLYGLFRFAARVGPDGEYIFFTTDPGKASLVGSPLGVGDLRNDAGDVWSTEESTIITSFRLDEKDIVLWTGQAGSDAPIDFLAARDRTLVVDNPQSPPDLVDGQEQSWSLPGIIISPFGLVGPTIASGVGLDVAYFGALAQSQFARLGTGALEFHVELLGPSDPGAKVGDLVTLNLPQRPVGNVRGGQRIVQVLKRTETPSGPVFEGWDVSEQTIAPVVPTFTLAASSADPSHVATISVTNGAALIAANEQVRVEWAAGPTTPTDGTLLTYLVVPPADLTTINTPPVVAGTKLWVRMRGEAPGLQPTAFTAWASVTLGSGLGTPTGLTHTSVDGATENVSWTPAGTYDFLVIWLKLSTDTTFRAIDILPAGSSSYTFTNLTAGDAYVWGIQEFLAGPVPFPGTMATDSFTTGASVPTLAPPTLPQAFVGRRDPTTGQTIIDGTFGLNVLAAKVPENIQFEVAVETSVGSNTPGTYSVLAIPLAAQFGFTTATGLAPNDGLRRYLRAKATWPGYTDSTYTTAQSVFPWVASAQNSGGVDAVVVVSSANTGFPNGAVATASPNIGWDFSVAGIAKALIAITSQAAGDLMVFAAGVWTRLGIGSNGQVLTVVAGAPAWAAAASGGSAPWSQNTATTTGLTYGYFGGEVVNSSGALTRIANGTIALANNATNYVERNEVGTVFTNTTGFTAASGTLSRIPMAKVVTASGAITSVEDDRMLAIADRATALAVQVTYTTASLADGATETGTIAMPAGAREADLEALQTDHAAWVRCYATAAARSADSTRPITSDPTPGTGVLGDFLPLGTTIPCGPPVGLYNGDTPQGSVIYIAITNKSGGTTTITATFTLRPY